MKKLGSEYHRTKRTTYQFLFQYLVYGDEGSIEFETSVAFLRGLKDYSGLMDDWGATSVIHGHPVSQSEAIDYLKTSKKKRRISDV